MRKTLHVVKIGGNVINSPEKLDIFLHDFSQIEEPKILIHGGGKIASQKAEEMNIPQQMLEGRRITDKDTLELITMVYGGLLSKNIVASLSAYGDCALGLSGADGALISSVKRPAAPLDYGYVGDVKTVNIHRISMLLESGFVPVFCAITHDGNGQLLNTNADTMASVITAAMSKEYDCHLYYCFEQKGVLSDIDKSDSVIPEITPQYYAALLAENKIFKGMIPKLDNAFNAVKEGGKKVYILKAEDLSALILTQENHGTRITK